MPRAEERRRKRLAQLIELEGGLDPDRRQAQPGHYVIAQRVIDFEDSDKDFRQMAQSLRQVVQGKINLGPKTVKRIEEAYAVDGRHGLRAGWFDDPQDDASTFSDDAADTPSPADAVDTFGRMFQLYQDVPEERRAKLLAQVRKIIDSYRKGN